MLRATVPWSLPARGHRHPQGLLHAGFEPSAKTDFQDRQLALSIRTYRRHVSAVASPLAAHYFGPS
ncbi:hypothetical protein BN381_20040 [Candidatus Microthrix parvicella RN1]|uniref:Uncharacterized protein n=1 Tax=Candidatus Neomicrothrix parvicella RN1 TaxID=1229780 RepID=R4Z1S1_9ACTN|nr:hypothetical protein BN381_20040 [Candidatus Microthrix parvicella RN1]